MATDSPAAALQPGVRAERIRSALRARSIGLAGGFAGETWRALLLERGRAELDGPEGALGLEAPCLMWVPWSAERRIRLAAGTVGIQLLVGATALAGAIGHNPESADLRFMAERPAILPLAGRAPLLVAFTQCLEGILRERAGEAGAVTVVEACLRILLVLMWRELAGTSAKAGAGSPAERILGRFNTLVEVHFRERWTVARYARALGISRDRLNDICRRLRGRTPGQMIQARIGIEARLLLENSGQSIDQIAATLGFASTAHFSRFFKALAGVPPGRYRRSARQSSPAGASRQPSALYEWP